MQLNTLIIPCGYFGLTVPVISVKPCHLKRSFKVGYFFYADPIHAGPIKQWAGDKFVEGRYAETTLDPDL